METYVASMARAEPLIVLAASGIDANVGDNSNTKRNLPSKTALSLFPSCDYWDVK